LAADINACAAAQSIQIREQCFTRAAAAAMCLSRLKEV
jgi:hypothetical protein